MTTTDATVAEGLRPLLVSIDTLRPMQGNPRKGDVEAVKRSLVAFGQRKPVVAMSDGTITAGHHLHAAAVSLGWTEIAAVFCEDDDATAKAFALADNRTGDLGRYDNEALLAMMTEVRDADSDLLASTSWSDDDLTHLIELTTPKLDDGPEPDPTEATSGLTCPRCGYDL